MSEYLDLSRLRARLRERPRTKTSQVRQAWPDIRDLLEAGHSLKDVWTWLNEIGLEIGYARLSHCISQLRLRDEAVHSRAQDLRRGFAPVPFESEWQTAAQEQSRVDEHASQAPPWREARFDPLRNVREQRTRKRSFEYDPFPAKGLTR